MFRLLLQDGTALADVGNDGRDEGGCGERTAFSDGEYGAYEYQLHVHDEGEGGGYDSQLTDCDEKDHMDCGDAVGVHHASFQQVRTHTLNIVFLASATSELFLFSSMRAVDAPPAQHMVVCHCACYSPCPCCCSHLQANDGNGQARRSQYAGSHQEQSGTTAAIVPSVNGFVSTSRVTVKALGYLRHWFLSEHRSMSPGMAGFYKDRGYTAGAVGVIQPKAGVFECSTAIGGAIAKESIRNRLFCFMHMRFIGNIGRHFMPVPMPEKVPPRLKNPYTCCWMRSLVCTHPTKVPFCTWETRKMWMHFNAPGERGHAANVSKLVSHWGVSRFLGVVPLPPSPPCLVSKANAMD